MYDQIGRKKQVRDDSATGPLRTESKYDSLYGGQTGFNGHWHSWIRPENMIGPLLSGGFN
jgi:hypothetical protein